ncbi:thiamine pyrophosphate-dependent enzyme [Pseudomonas sp. Irchel s3a18]|uniref:thiamine pyrophosphate-dependent enzyme n=1 Tax=Pseudomonas sp. Irchel s3a18 TaxID=2009053 RepID=UPI000BA401C4|nr:thiamine pyrophosphate-dependent enzyme [Pseudomonas sp. Irchel s3a18]
MNALTRLFTSTREMTLGQLVGHVLVESDISDLFCIPGDFTMQLSREMLGTPGLALRTMSHEYSTTLTALGYALGKEAPGAVCFTYGVGALNAINGIAQAYVERLPLLVISGSPGHKERQGSMFAHHTIVDHGTQLRLMKEITVHQACIEDPHQAQEQLREAIVIAMRHSRPVYVEIPRDLFLHKVRHTPRRAQLKREPMLFDHVALSAAEKALRLIEQARQPVLVPGLDVKRGRLGSEALALCEALGLPWVETPMSRGGLQVDHANYRGIYAGPASPSRLTQALVDDCDVLILLGEPNSDVNMGIASQIAGGRLIHANDGLVMVGRQRFDLSTEAFLRALVGLAGNSSRHGQLLAPLDGQETAFIRPPLPERLLASDTALTPYEIIDELNRVFADNAELDLIVDCGDAFFMSLGMFPRDVLASSLYMSMGLAVPGAIGYQLATGKRPIVLVGDGAFHMTGNELMHAARFGTSPIIVILNNRRWTSLSGKPQDRALTEQPDLEFVNIARFHKVQGFTAHTSEQLRGQLAEAMAMDRPILIDARIAPDTRSYLCERFFDAVQKQQHLPKA